MLLKHIFMVGIGATLIFLLYIPLGCSREKTTVNKAISLNEPRKPVSPERVNPLRDKGETHVPYVIDEAERKKHMKAVEQCQKLFEKCVERCSSDVCEEGCLNDLSSCEKGLPMELRTLKQE